MIRLRIPIRKKSNIVLSLFMFLLIFLPPVLRVNPRIMVSILGLLYIGYTLIRKKRIVIHFKDVRYLLGYVPFLIYVLLSFFLRYFVGDVREEIIATFISFTLMIVHVFIGCVTLNLIIDEYNISNEDFFTSIAVAGCIEIILVIMSFIVPSIRNAFVTLIINNSTSESVSGIIRRHLYYRGYGLANDIFDSFGYISALMITVLFMHAIYNKRHGMMLVAVFLIIMPALNARTGLMLSAIGIGLCLLIRFSPEKILKYIGGTIIVVIMGAIAFRFLPETTSEWIIKGVTSTIQLLYSNEKTGVYANILDDDIVLPPKIIFGVGVPPEMTGLSGIDNGYIQCIWRFGLIGTILLVIGIVYMTIYLYKRAISQEIKTIITVYCVLIVVYLIKLYSLGNTSANILFLSIAPIMMKNKKKEQGIIINLEKDIEGSIV